MTAPNDSKQEGNSLFDIGKYFGAGKDKDYFIEQISVLLSSGMDLLSALASIRDEVTSKRMKDVLSKIYDEVEQGMPLWLALERSKVLPRYFISLVKIGESSGMLIENLKVVSLQYQKDKTFRAKLSAAMVYPIFVLIITVVVGLSTSVVVLPRITGVYQNMDIELSFFTIILITAGNFFQEWGLIAVPSFVVIGFFAVYFLFFYERTKYVGEAVLLRIPGIRGLIVEVELSRFGYILGNLLKSGVPVVDALDLLSSLTTFNVYRKFYKHLEESIEKGETFKESFSKYRGVESLFPISFQRLIISGEQSGGLSESLARMSEVYEEKIEVTSRNLSVVLEPILLILVWGGVLVVALGAITPMYGLMGSIGGSSEVSGKSGTVVVRDDNGAESDTDPRDEEMYVDDDVVLDEEGGGVEPAEEADIPAEPEIDLSEVDQDAKLEIQESSSGFPSVHSVPEGPAMIGVTPGNVYVYIDYMDGWYQIVLEDGTLGWVEEDSVKLY